MKNFKNTSSLIRVARLSAGLSQHSLAKIVGVDGQFISNIERGVCGVPSSRVPALARALRISKARFAEAAISDYGIRYKRGEV